MLDRVMGVVEHTNRQAIAVHDELMAAHSSNELSVALTGFRIAVGFLLANHVGTQSLEAGFKRP
jgi:hypothetical protein